MKDLAYYVIRFYRESDVRLYLANLHSIKNLVFVTAPSWRPLLSRVVLSGNGWPSPSATVTYMSMPLLAMGSEGGKSQGVYKLGKSDT